MDSNEEKGSSSNSRSEKYVDACIEPIKKEDLFSKKVNEILTKHRK